ncbi:expressed unknown protein [Seminavis robusta]|uniref:Uncharacterized protein n=1 Tax=Seminavis robusta TaxID=568900 RepID=A0A9N8HDJ3_9STRA|nr:expressed unknown protein [Seminavis robusta]|eukprot:Sro261_g101910.1 n/a (461) ;mRNA; r:80536-81918
MRILAQSITHLYPRQVEHSNNKVVLLIALFGVMKLNSVLQLFCLFPAAATAFVVPAPRRVSHSFLSLSTQDGYNDAAGGGSSSGGGAWKLGNDFPQLLNQCAIQSFLTVVRSLRDPQTIRWVHNFTQPVIPKSKSSNARLTGTTEATNAITSDTNVKNPDGKSYSKLLTYHGLGVMNTTLFPTWKCYFAELLEKPMEVFVVQSSGIEVKDYELDINPASLCTRIISVREQIAEEFAHDLGVMANMGQHTMDSYWDYLDNQLDEDEDYTTTDQLTPIGVDRSTTSNPVTMSSGADGSPRRLPPHNLVFLEYSLDSMGDMMFSPLRKGNFDLVTLLATQESIHRILNKDNNREESFAIYQKYLLNFYVERLETHFTGIQRYGRADDFLEELLFAPPASRVSMDAGFSALVDPVTVAEMILKERRQVALEWQAMSKDVPNQHIEIKRLQLDRLMQSYNKQDVQ